MPGKRICWRFSDCTEHHSGARSRELSSIVWHYRSGRERIRRWKANQLTEELTALTANHPIKVRHGRKEDGGEVTAAENNKGPPLPGCSRRTMHTKSPCCPADDLTDESMFELQRRIAPGDHQGWQGGTTQAQFPVWPEPRESPAVCSAACSLGKILTARAESTPTPKISRRQPRNPSGVKLH